MRFYVKTSPDQLTKFNDKENICIVKTKMIVVRNILLGYEKYYQK